MSTILCIDDEPVVSAMLERHLTTLGHEALVRSTIREGLEAVARENIDLVISDYQLPEATGLDLLSSLREQGSEVPVIIMTDYPSIENAVLSIRHGAIDYLSKPLRAEALRLAVNNGIEISRLRRENERYRREINSLQGMRVIVGHSPALAQVMETIAQVAPTKASVLLEGESGTGKELFARALHEQSPRRGEAFVTVNCAALPEGLVESTLFGHERGAFTGASARSAGAFERAHRGTLLLDEISEMRLDLQSKLLRVIQESEVERVGGSQAIRVDVRLIATTNRDLRVEAEAGRFRKDLYYRLNVIPIRTPPLRERREDIPVLIEHFVAQGASRLGIRAPEVPSETLQCLSQRDWPGNIRELGNAIERALILSKGGRLGPDSFVLGEPVAPIRSSSLGPPVEQHAPSAEMPINLRELERIAIERALVATRGHRTRAAHLLGISERTLRNKLNGPAADDSDSARREPAESEALRAEPLGAERSS